MSKHHDIAIRGGGLLGRMLAWQLSSLGLDVVVYEKGDIQGSNSAAYVAAAMLAPWAEAIESNLKVSQLGQVSLSLWQNWIDDLEKQGFPVFFQQNGSLIVWHQEDQELATWFKKRLHYVHHQTCWQDWEKAEIVQFEPFLNTRFRQGLFLPKEAQLDNRALLQALTNAAIKQGTTYFWNHNEHDKDINKTAKWVIDCRGYSAKKEWNQVGLTHLRGVRGEVIRVYAPEVKLHRPIRLLHPRYPLYICPKPNHIFVIGATQLESEHQGAITVRSSLELLSALYSLCPAFGEAQILESLSGVRPVLNHDQPEIRYCEKENKIEINGLFRHGFMIAPVVVQSAIKLIQHLEQQQLHKQQDWKQWLIGENNGN